MQWKNKHNSQMWGPHCSRGARTMKSKLQVAA